jgi:hypothetical protein
MVPDSRLLDAVGSGEKAWNSKISTISKKQPDAEDVNLPVWEWACFLSLAS